ncbi:MAG: glycosyltransferase family 1 protein [Proteobacteria bacterium]|nr:glycosyltransferase family 1 protein [Pseudomonadota bacterium]
MTTPAAEQAEALIAAADRLYQARDWAAALDHYRRLEALAPALAAQRSVPVIVGHCRIELDDPAAPDGGTVSGGFGNSERDLQLVTDLRVRLLELCYAGDFARAARLLRWLAHFDLSIKASYDRALTWERSACCDLLDTVSAPIEPPFVRELALSEAEVAAVKQRYRGTRLLLVSQRFFDDPARQHDLTDNLARAARGFGFELREINSHALKPGVTVDGWAADLQSEIIAFHPQLLFFTDLYNSGISRASDAVTEQIATVLEQVRELLGVRVVRSLPDGWHTVIHGDAQFFRGLGRSVDLLHHCHPTVLGRGTAAQRAATWCYPYPTSIEPPTVAPGSVPRGCFVGRVHYSSIARIAWWVEAAQAGLPIDFVIKLPWEIPRIDQPPISDIAFSNLLCGHQLGINLTQRFGGVCILTGRTMEIPLAGGVLLEENSIDTAHFFQPGVHYMPFETLGDLSRLTERLLQDPARRHALAEAGQRWARRYFSGDYFWAELMARLERS